MAHQITASDKIYLHKTGAWHGKGTIFPEALDANGVYQAAFGWEPKTRFLWMKTDPNSPASVRIEDKKAMVRSDNGEYLGTVGMGWTPVGNKELLDLVGEALPGVKFETAGSLFGGRRVFALAMLGGFEPVKGDENRNYLMIANGHDGSFRVFFGRTSVRIVCNNTLTSAISGGEVNSYRHTTNVKTRVQDAAKAFAKARQSAEEFAEVSKKLALVRVNQKQVRDYLTEVFPAPKANGEIDGSNVLDSILTKGAEESRLMSDLLAGDRKAMDKAMARHEKLLDTILTIYGSEKNAGGFGENLWTAFNSCTDYIDHHRTTRGQDDSDRADNRFASTVWGSGNDIKQNALAAAVKMMEN